MSGGAHDELQIVEIYWSQLRAVDDRLLRRARARAHRRRLARSVAIAVLALLLAAAAAVAAKTLLFGDDAPARFPSTEGIGAIEPGSSRVLSPRESDADGGPAWGVRAFSTAKGKVCLQAGRVADGELVALGVAGAFGDDGQAHRLQTEALGCTSLVDGHARHLSVPDVLPRSALVTNGVAPGVDGCLTPDAALAHRGAFSRCSRADLRTVIAGFAGQNVAAVVMDGVEHRVRSDEDGAYIYVLDGDRDLSTARFSWRYADGTTCRQSLGPDNPVTPSPECRRLAGG